MPDDRSLPLQTGFQNEGEDNSEGDWITTFADISLLLLVFFILLFSMSELDPTKFNDSFTSVKAALGKDGKDLMTARITSDEAAIVESVRLQRQLIEEQRRTYTEMRTFLNRKGVEGTIGAVFDEGIITLRAPGDVLFPSGEVDLTPTGKRVIKMLRDFLIQKPDQQINIRGFTDNVPPRPGSRYKDNWEISSLRAVNVLRFLLEQGIEPSRMTATGLADLEPLYPNSSPDNKAKNRRVEFVLEKRIGG